MEEPIRIAQVIGNANAGGVESMIMNLYKNIDRNKIQFDFFVEQTCPIIDKNIIEKMGGKIVLIPPYKHLFRYEKVLTKLFKEGNYKIVHSNMNTISVFTLRAAKKAGVKVRIAHSHSTASRKELLRSLLKYTLRPFSKVYANYYFACSKKAGEWQFGKRVFNKGKVNVINSSIDIEKFKYSEENRIAIRKEFNIKDNTFLLGHIGRFVSVKNHIYLLDIFKEIKRINDNSKLMLVGDGPLKEEIKEYSKRIGINNDVIFAGLTSDTSPFYSAFDSFLLPSLYEGLPVVGVEAQANGLLSVFSDKVTREMKITNDAYFLPITNPPLDWAKFVLKHNVNDRISANEYMNNGPFDIKNAANVLTNIYFQFLKEQYGE